MDRTPRLKPARVEFGPGATAREAADVRPGLSDAQQTHAHDLAHADAPMAQVLELSPVQTAA
jgi:hypothetical protein